MDATLDRLRAALADRYDVEREIGAGGMAIVYLAEDLRHHRKVAVKVLNPDLAAALGPERFLREIEIAAALTHPHILPLHDSGEADGFLYYVMPFIEGESLRERLVREGALDVPDATRILRHVVDALGEAHAAGVVHRDVKPANVLLSGRHAMVADFGVAKAVSEASGRHKVTTVGVALGTPRYMAPEQAAADPDTDHRADIFAAGVIAYEMLTGTSPFDARSAQGTLAAILTKDLDPVAEVREDVPKELSGAVMRCLAKDPDERWQSASELLEALELLATPTMGVTPMHGVPLVSQRRKIWRWAAAGAAAVLAGGLLLRGLFAEDPEIWAQTVAFPEIERLVDAGDFQGGYAIALQVAEVLPEEPRLEEVWPTLAQSENINTEPPGARVYRRAYAATDGEWEDLGTTPLEDVMVPLGPSAWRYELDGYQTVETFTSGNVWRMTLDPVDDIPEGMVRVLGTNVTVDGRQVRLDDFYMSRFEVTNAEYEEFVDAGGYERRDLWEHPFLEGDVEVMWDETMPRFVDRTGRPGPSTWEVGSYPEGQADYPVGGVSWYEAAAYARFREMELPTLHHWRRAFGRGSISYFVPLSNLDGPGPAPVGASAAMNLFGTYDLAGNVREWCFNRSGAYRFILGGGWNDPLYLAGPDENYSQPAFDRSATNGIRLVRYLDEGDDLDAMRMPVDPIRPPDFAAIEPVPDEVLEVYREMFSYDPAPLEARVEQVDTAQDWVRQRVTVEAAFTDERLALYLYLPRDAEPPFQTVVYFPGSGAFDQSSIDNYRTIHLDFVLKSGRAFAFPVYKGTFESETDLLSLFSVQTTLYRDHVVRWTRETTRTIDYLESRPDIDASALAYYGYSWGGQMGPIVMANEPRLKAGVLYVAGFWHTRPHPAADEVTYAPHVTTPVVMLNGRFDPTFPLETAARPMFDALGTPEEHKEFIVSDGGHFVPRTELIRHTLRWLDRYLGPVR